MRMESWRVALVSALGALIGGIVAYDLGGHYSWTIGAPVGGMFAWITVSFEHFRASIARAYGEYLAWQPNRLHWLAFFANFIGEVAIATTIVSCLVLTVVFTDDLYLPANHDKLMRAIASGLMMWLFFAGLCVPHALDLTKKSFWIKTEEENNTFLKDSAAGGWKMALYGNPIVAPFYLIYWAFYGLMVALSNIPKIAAAILHGVVTMAHFIGAAYIYAHTSERNVCLVAASFGVVAGHLYSPGLMGILVGTVVGGILGFIDHRVIAIGLLKLVPTR